MLFTAAGDDPATTGVTVSVTDSTKVAVGFGDGSAWHQVVSGDVLSPGWHHLAVVFDGTLLQVHVDGVLAFGSTDVAGIVPVAAPISSIAASSNGFAGVLDEIRFWSVARGAVDVRASMHRRLTGLEPGLAAYFRLDEGRGPTVFDLAGRGVTGTVTGATWVSSDAPVADSAGISRSAIRFDGASVTAGLSAALYYQQENVASGYAGTPKPMKQAARVMVATSVATGSAANPAIAVLDFGLAGDGTLARIDTDVVLADLAPPTSAGASPNSLLDQLASLESKRAGLAARVASLTASVGDLTTSVGQLTGLVGGVTTPVTFTGSLAGLNASVTALLAHEQHVHDLQYGGGELEAALRQQLISATRTQIATDMAPLQAALPPLQTELAAARSELQDAQAQLTQAEESLDAIRRAVDADVVLPMPLLDVDTTGLTVAGGLLGSIPSVDTPVLFDSALGRLALYARGAQDQFLVAYYDTFTGRPTFTVPAAAGVVTLFGRNTDPAFDDLTISVGAGADDTTCTVAIALPGGAVPVTETWSDLPRDAQQLAAILNGTPSEPVFVGQAASATDGKVDQLVLAAGVALPLAQGALVRVGDTVVAVTAAAGRDATTVSIEPAALTIVAGTPIYKVAYDYAASARCRAQRARRWPLGRGSWPPTPGPPAARSWSARPRSRGATPSCQWFADPPGTTLDFDGAAVHAGVLARTAMAFDGVHDGVVLPPSDKLSITGQITMEAWIRPQATDGFRDIVVHGYTLDPDAEVYLRIASGQYQVGSWDGTDHFAAAPVPSGDVGTWVHLAGAFDGASWRLYRNGILLASTVDSKGAVPVDAGWGIGVAADGTERFFSGDIDDVRIWNVARNPEEISEALGQRLGGTEGGLVGYFYGTDGHFADRTTPPAAPCASGAPAPATSPARLAELSGFDVAGRCDDRGVAQPDAGVDHGPGRAASVGGVQLHAGSAPGRQQLPLQRDERLGADPLDAGPRHHGPDHPRGVDPA